MSISFSGIRDLATFVMKGFIFGFHEGYVAKMIAPQTIGPCDEGDRFHGVVETIERGDEYGVMRKTGYATLSFTGKPPGVGIVYLSADGKGGVKVEMRNNCGAQYLVVDYSEEERTVTIYLG